MTLLLDEELAVRESYVIESPPLYSFGVMSLLDMLEFAAESFWKASQILTEIRNNPASASRPVRAKEMRNALEELVANLETLRLPVSLREFGKFNAWMNQTMREIHAITPLETQKTESFKIEPIVRIKIEQLSSVVHSELEARKFFLIPEGSAGFYDQKELFGIEVTEKFPTIQYDMVEAGNCYATGRATATVFHLMRIMESGVQEFGKKLGVTFTGEKNWQCILDQSNKAIKELPSKDDATIELSQAAAHLYNVKLVCRNDVMHPKGIYTLEEAKDLITQVRLFMVQLASII